MISDSKRALCPECGAPCTLSWSGLDLVENTGDETLATKHYEFVYGDVDKLKEALKQAKEAMERIDTDVTIPELFDATKAAKEALETIKQLGL